MISDQILLSYIKKSKVFCARENKSEIISALSNPLNLELKQQLIENLDSKYQSNEYTNPDEVKDKLSTKADDYTDVDDNMPPDDLADGEKSSKSSHKSSTSTAKTPSSPSSTDTEEDASSEDMVKVKDKPKEKSKEDKPVEEVSESTDIDSNQIDTKSIEDLLNTNKSTDGVNYIQVKSQDNITEIWIIYRDNVNINDKISDIMGLVSSKYPNWQFNRVARTYNAIIFTCDDRQEDVVIE